FWLPEFAAPAEGEPNPARPEPGVIGEALTEVSLAYRLYWMAPGATPHTLGRVAATRQVIDAQAVTASCVIDFESDDLNAIPADTGLASQIETGEDFPLLEKFLVKNPVTGGWRLTFKLRWPQEKNMVQSLISAGEPQPSPRFRARLIRGENVPEPLTETWVLDQPVQ
ncbi:MAG: glucan biosynthesis protein, partial [Candidatus Adiutrix sp.]|nr:glucan biosynthesis protein [Candidatus Adiutrix sp.]